MKILVFTALYGRSELSKLFFESLSLDVYCSVSTDEDEALAKQYAKDYVRCDNYPLSNKFNNCIELLRDVEFDYAMILGSDDFISSNFIDVVSKEIKSDYIAFRDIWFYNVGLDRTTYMCYKSVMTSPVGSGSLFSKKLLDEMDYKLWNEPLNSYLDTHRHKRLKKYNCQYLCCKELGVEMLDVKLAMNITDPNIVKALEKDELKLIGINKFKGLTSNEPKHINKRNKKNNNMSNKVKIKVIKDHAAGLKKGEEKNCDVRNARLLEANGYVEILDEKKSTPAPKKATTKKSTSKKAPTNKKKPCEKCDDDKPCKDCEESAKTTNKPKRKTKK